MKAKKILVVGSANMDLIMRVSRLPKPGESMTGKHFMTAHGGKGANQAVAAARLGAQVSFVGVVGDDAFGALQREAFQREGIALEHLQTTTNAPTGTALILLTDAGQNAIMVAPGANYELRPEHIPPLRTALCEADAVVTQLETPLETVEAVLRFARETGVLSILDVGQARQVPADILACADIVSPNETEAEALTGIVVDTATAAHNAASRLCTMGVAHVVMKLGGNGCLYMGTGADTIHAPAFETAVADTTAAGDAFTAALAVAWDRAPMSDVLCFANAAGALATTVQGAQPAMPTRDAVTRFLAEQGCPTQITAPNP